MTVGYHFFGSGELFYEKRTLWNDTEFSLQNVSFYEPGQNCKRTRTFDTRFQERDQSVITNAH